MASYSPDAPTIVDHETSTWLLPVESGSLDETSANVQLNQYEAPGASVQTDIGGKLTEAHIAQKRKRKKICDDRFKQKLKERMTILQGLVPGCSKVTGQVPKLDAIINYVQLLLCQVEEAAKHIEENKQLNAENTGLKEKIRLLVSDGKQLEHRSGSLQEIVSINAASLSLKEEIPHEIGREWTSVLPSKKEAIRGTCGSYDESDEGEFSSGGAEDEPLDEGEFSGGGAEDEPSAFDGISGEPSAKVLGSNKRKRSVEEAEVDQAKGCQPSNEAALSPSLAERVRQETEIGNALKFLKGLVPGYSKVAGKAAMLDETINCVQSLQLKNECLRMKLSLSHHISNGDAVAANTDILKKLEADDESSVEFSDFTGLDGERVKVGKYSVPLSLHRIAKNIMDVHGDVSVACKMNQCAAEPNYIMFCASLKEMSNPRLEQLTEDRILKWRDAIKDGLRSNFNVEFAMDHLKKIVRAYIGLMELIKLENEALRMFNLIDATEEFNDKPDNFGEQPIIDYENVNGGDDDFDRGSQTARKQRQLTAIQIKLLERSFEFENKLKVERNFQLAKEVGLQPQQVVNWFISRSRNKQPMKGQH